MYLMYCCGLSLDGPSIPKTCNILTLKVVYSQSSMNSHRCWRAVDLHSGMFLNKSKIASTIDFLYWKFPSSLNTFAKNANKVGYFFGNLMLNDLTASTTMILNSSVMSFKKS
eukprot:NODE_141_length_15967_cov_0.946118.p10 type:complete len:112 gc:universal NODE_141_length_15967_cov_0.946118:6459-6794(+)